MPGCRGGSRFVEGCLLEKVDWFIGFLVSGFLGFKVSRLFGFTVCWFQSFKVSKIYLMFRWKILVPYYKMSISYCSIDVGPILKISKNLLNGSTGGARFSKKSNS